MLSVWAGVSMWLDSIVVDWKPNPFQEADQSQKGRNARESG